MRFIWRVLLLSLLSGCLLDCAKYNNLDEGIHYFRDQRYRDAFIRLKPEACKGQPDAQYAVGYMYYYGRGVVENRQKAWYWITKAARAGQADAVEAATILAKKKPRYASNRPKSSSDYVAGIRPFQEN